MCALRRCDRESCVQGYLTDKKPPPRRTLQQDCVLGHMMALGRGGVSHEQGTPVLTQHRLCSPLVPLGSSSFQHRRTPELVLQKSHASFRITFSPPRCRGSRQKPAKGYPHRAFESVEQCTEREHRSVRSAREHRLLTPLSFTFFFSLSFSIQVLKGPYRDTSPIRKRPPP